MSGDIPLALNRDVNRCPRCRSLDCITDHEATDRANQPRDGGYSQGLFQVRKSTWR